MDSAVDGDVLALRWSLPIGAGLLTGVIDAVMIAGTEMGYEDLAALPVIVEEPGTALLSTGAVHDDLIDLIRPVLTVDHSRGSVRDRI